MDILLRQVTVFDPSSPFHLQKADIFISDGFIKQIENTIDKKADKIIDVNGLAVSSGWVDVFANFCDPGYEHKETLESGANAAMAGGYTDVFLVPNTSPSVHNKAAVEYIVQRSKAVGVTLHPIASITKNNEGKELAEMYDMHTSGAVAFSDGYNCLQSSGIALKALQYVKAVDKTIIQLPDDKSINANGLMNEGIASTVLGLPGKPSIAEELMIARDIELVKYTGSKIHITGVSTKKSLELIRAAKKDGLNVTCSVTPFHLLYTEEDLKAYDTNLKLNPPLRTVSDKEALKQAVLDGTVDCIASHHSPQHIDDKIVEFEYAKNGMISLQTSFALVRTAIPEISIERLVELFSIVPRSIFDLSIPSIKVDERAAITLFLPEAEWTFNLDDNLSRSNNTSLFSKTLKGKPLGIINKDKVFLNEL